MGRIRLLAAPGGHDQLREALAGLAEGRDQFDISWAESVAACQDRLDAADCVIVDAPSEGETETLETICAEFDPFPVYVVGDVDRVARAFDNGVTSYLDPTTLGSTDLLGTRIETAVERARRHADRTHTLRQYETFLEVVPDTVVTTNLDGRITGVYGHLGWSGYSAEEWIGEHFSLCFPKETVELGEQMAIDLLKQDDRGTKTYETDIITKSGERIPHEIHLSLLPPDADGQIPGTISVLRDISKQRERQAQLQRQNDRLERFSSVISHDLRNPLNVASTRLDLAREECNSEHLDHVAQAHDRMERLIEDLLELARAQDSPLSAEPVSLRALVEDCWQHVHTGDGDIVIETDQTIRADESRLKQLLENLVRNAVEHGSSPESRTRQDGVEHGESVTTVTVGALPDGFYIEDDGSGIPESERGSVFESGYSTAEEGTGFGLSIVEQVVEDHGWEIRTTDASGGGARFEITGIDLV